LCDQQCDLEDSENTVSSDIDDFGTNDESNEVAEVKNVVNIVHQRAPDK
jgi:hypothetical protein